MLRVQLSPRLVGVKETEVAKFSCKYSCAVTKSNSHTTLWLLGDRLWPSSFSNNQRSRSWFTLRAGGGLTILNVEDKSTCMGQSGHIIHEMSLVVTNASKWNRTPLQCVAQPTSPGSISFFSSYSILFVEPVASKRLKLYKIIVMLKKKYGSKLVIKLSQQQLFFVFCF